MRAHYAAVLISSLVLLGACEDPISKEAKQELRQPVNCATAQQDLATLEREKASNAERAAAGITTALPIGLVAGIVSGNAGDKFDVATGVYSKQIDDKIAEIKRTCGIK